MGHAGAEAVAAMAVLRGMGVPVQRLARVGLAEEPPGGRDGGSPHLVSIAGGDGLGVAGLTLLGDLATAPPRGKSVALDVRSIRQASPGPFKRGDRPGSVSSFLSLLPDAAEN